MKTAIAIVLALLMGIALGSTATTNPTVQTPRDHRFYQVTAQVTYLEDDSDTVTFTDSRGELFDLSGIEDWMLEDHAILVIDDKGTSDLIDDEIVSATYTG